MRVPPIPLRASEGSQGPYDVVPSGPFGPYRSEWAGWHLLPPGRGARPGGMLGLPPLVGAHLGTMACYRRRTGNR